MGVRMIMYMCECQLHENGARLFAHVQTNLSLLRKCSYLYQIICNNECDQAMLCHMACVNSMPRIQYKSQDKHYTKEHESDYLDNDAYAPNSPNKQFYFTTESNSCVW